MSGRRGCLTAIALLIIIAAVAVPSVAYREHQVELRSGNLLFQDQFYFTAPVQVLFHRQTAAGTDAEAFSFSPAPGGGIALAQTCIDSEIATDTGYFMSFSSFKKFNCPTGEGYLHTSIGDPLTSRTPVFSRLTFPAMIKDDEVDNLAGSLSVNTTVTTGSAGQDNITLNGAAIKVATDMPAISGTGNNTLNNLTITEPLIKKQFSSNQIGEQDTTNILAVKPRPTPRPAPLPTPLRAPAPTVQPTPRPTPAFGVTATNRSAPGSPTPTPSPTPAPAPSAQPVPAGLPIYSDLLTKPMSRQAYLQQRLWAL